MKKINVYLSGHGIESLPMYYRTIIKQVIRAGIGSHQGCEISMSFVSADEIRNLNKQYRQKDTPTDVLSFPGIRSETHVTSDIIICSEVAANQAAEYGHTLEREIAFLTAHGLLHLMGCDHQTAEDESKMIKAQNAILEKVGITR